MNFRELKQGNELFIMNRDTMEVKHGNITHVSAPHIDTKINMTPQQVVDVTALVDGKGITYVAPEGSSVTYCGSLVISCSKEYILNEAKAIKSQCEQLLSSIDDTKSKLEKCNKTISELDDVFRERQENDARLSKLENMMQSLLDKLT